MIPKEELRSRTTSISDMIHEIISETSEIGFHEFEENEPLKERVFAQLQEMGQLAYDLSTNLNVFEKNKELFEKLSQFKNARYNYIAEIELHSVWNIIKNDFEEIERELLVTAKGY